MRASVLREFCAAPEVEVVADPPCPRDGAVIKLLACGVCRSDHHAWVGADPDVELPHVMGHELAGEVVECGRDVARFAAGDPVTAPFILGCGSCPECLGGDSTICGRQDVIGFTRWGAFAELIAIPNADFNLVRLPESLSAEAAAGMGCRMATAFRALADRAVLRPGETLAVHGCGGVGLSAVMIAGAIGAEVIAVDVSERALELARGFGAAHAINAASGDDPARQIIELTGGGADASIDALGREATFLGSIRSLRRRGRHVQIGMPVGVDSVVSLPLLETVYSRQISICGSRGASPGRFGDLFGLLGKAGFDPGRLVTGRIPLSRAGEALEAMDSGSAAGFTVIDDFSA